MPRLRVIRVGSIPIESNEWEPPDRRKAFIANGTRCEDGETMCTISPLPKSERILQSEWVAAYDGAFVPLEEMR